MDLREHVAHTDMTAIYPDAGTGSMTAVLYVALGLGGEATEVLEKEMADDSSGVVAELGDTLWYISRLHRELALDPLQTVDAGTAEATRASAGAAELVVAAGRVQELAKKALRDDAGVLTPDRRKALTSALTAVVASWFAVHVRHRLDPQRTAAANITKLLDRRDRHVLAGSGDHR